MLNALADLAEVVAHGIVRGDDIAGEDAGGLPAVSDGRRKPRPQLSPGRLQNVATEVVAPLALEIRHRVELGDEEDKLVFDLQRVRRRRQLFGGVEMAFERHRSDHQLPGLLLDGDELRDVLILKLGPSCVEGEEGIHQLELLGFLGCICNLPLVQENDDVDPCTLQTLCKLDGFRTELEFLAIDPNLLLIHAGLQHIHSVVPAAVWEQCPIVRGELGPVATGRDLDT
mmetsp:Transcript_95883/g.310823  ORF Transcript_95883/g.310823 Transcript_95883/m.310823 type:complete len:228 (-) Transcript_95883:219-902(-)